MVPWCWYWKFRLLNQHSVSHDIKYLTQLEWKPRTSKIDTAWNFKFIYMYHYTNCWGWITMTIIFTLISFMDSRDLNSRHVNWKLMRLLIPNVYCKLSTMFQLFQASVASGCHKFFILICFNMTLLSLQFAHVMSHNDH